MVQGLVPHPMTVYNKKAEEHLGRGLVHVSPKSPPQDGNDDNAPCRLPCNPSVVPMLTLAKSPSLFLVRGI